VSIPVQKRNSPQGGQVHYTDALAGDLVVGTTTEVMRRMFVFLLTVLDFFCFDRNVETPVTYPFLYLESHITVSRHFVGKILNIFHKLDVFD